MRPKRLSDLSLAPSCLSWCGRCTFALANASDRIGRHNETLLQELVLPTQIVLGDSSTRGPGLDFAADIAIVWHVGNLRIVDVLSTDSTTNSKREQFMPQS